MSHSTKERVGLASVLRLPVRCGSVEDALASFREARIVDCVHELRGVRDVRALALRARALLRLGRPGEVVETTDLTGDACGDRGELALLLFVANSRIGNLDEANECLSAARAFAISSADLALEAETELYSAVTSFGHSDLTTALTQCNNALDLILSAPAPAACGFIPISHIAARTHEVLGIISAAQGCYRDFASHAATTLETLDRSKVIDVFHLGYALRNLAVATRDFDIEDRIADLNSRVADLEWTSDISGAHFAALEAQGWSAALRGNVVGALRFWRTASDAATTDPEKVIIAVNRAMASREFGHHASADEEIDYALGLAERYDWNGATADTREALLFLAQAATSFAPRRARSMLDRYTRIRDSMDARLSARLELRYRAEEAFTHGLVLRAEHRMAESAERLRFAFESWHEIGFEWRASRAALELAELNEGEVFRLAVARELHRRPESIFAARARAVA